jgi:hypothetical protein
VAGDGLRQPYAGRFRPAARHLGANGTQALAVVPERLSAPA